MFINLKILLSIFIFSFSWYSYSENLFEDYDKHKELTKDLVKPEKVLLKALYCDSDYGMGYKNRLLGATDGKNLYAERRRSTWGEYSYDLDKLALLKATFKLEKEPFLFLKSNDSFYWEYFPEFGDTYHRIQNKNVVQKKRNLNVFAFKNEQLVEEIPKNELTGVSESSTRLYTFDFESANVFEKRNGEGVEWKNCRVDLIYHYVFKDFDMKRLAEELAVE